MDKPISPNTEQFSITLPEFEPKLDLENKDNTYQIKITWKNTGKYIKYYFAYPVDEEFIKNFFRSKREKDVEYIQEVINEWFKKDYKVK